MIDPIFGGVILLWLISRSNLSNQGNDWENKKWVPMGWSEYQLQFEVNDLNRNMYMDKLEVKTFKEIDGVKELVSTSIGGYRLWITGEGIDGRRYPNPNDQWGTMFHGWNPSWIFTSFSEASTAASNWVAETIKEPETGGVDPTIPPVAPPVAPPLPPPLPNPPSGEPLPSNPPTVPNVPTIPLVPNPTLLTNNGVNALNGQDLSSIGGYSR